jgi:hypothetical protein
VERALGGEQDRLLVTRPGITRPGDAEAAVKAAVARFGVLAGNAATAQMGSSGELTLEQARRNASFPLRPGD